MATAYKNVIKHLKLAFATIENCHAIRPASLMRALHWLNYFHLQTLMQLLNRSILTGSCNKPKKTFPMLQSQGNNALTIPANTVLGARSVQLSLMCICCRPRHCSWPTRTFLLLISRCVFVAVVEIARRTLCICHMGPSYSFHRDKTITRIAAI